MELKRLYNKMYSEIGGERHPDIYWYLHERAKEITPKSFFESAVTAISCSGLNGEATASILHRAERQGFDWNYKKFATWDKQQLHNFMRELHGKAYQKWQAIHTIAQWLTSYRTPREFRDDVFRGRDRSADLNNADARALQARRLPWIGAANAQFIIRNMGGETIKCDRWVKAFLDYKGLSLRELSARLRGLSIPLGLFDMVLWACCERNVITVHRFADHFNKLFTKSK
jgi:hypothetical protein